MARAHFKHTCIDPDRLKVIQNCAVYLFAVDTGTLLNPPTGTAITGSMYAVRTGGAPIANPLISNSQGEVEAWLDTPQLVDVVVTDNGDAAFYPGGALIQFPTFKEIGHAYHDPADVGAGGGAHPDLAAHDTLGLATQAELDAVAAATGAHLTDNDDAHDAVAVSFTPFGTIVATNVQGAIEEAVAEAGAFTPGTGLDLDAGVLNIDASEFTTETQLQMFDDGIVVHDASVGEERRVSPVNLDNPRNGFKFANDLLFLNALTGGENVGEFEVALSGAGAVFALAAGDRNHPGVQTASTGTTSGGGSLIGMSGNAVRLGGGKARMSVCLKTEPTLSAAAQRYDIQAGFWDNGFADATDGVYLRYSDDINGGKWQLIAVSNGVSTVVDTGIAVTADTWYMLEVEVNADGSSAEAFINGASVGTVASNIPTAVGRETGGGVQIWKSVGATARTVNIDAVRLALDFTTAR